MTTFDLIAAAATSLGVITFAIIFTLLYHAYTKSSIKELKTGKRDVELVDACIHERQRSVKIRRRVVAIVKGVCFYGLIALLIPLFLLSLYSKLNGDVAMIRDRAMMVVASGSMSLKNEANDYLVSEKLDNQFDRYDVILLERVDPADLQVYDVIAFVNDQGVNTIHRIVGIKTEGGRTVFETRGDSNNTTDDYNPSYEDVIGRYTDQRVPSLGAVVLFFQSIGGVVTLLALFYCLYMLDHFNGKIREVEEERIEQIEAAIGFDELENAASMHADFEETLYYKGYAYIFNEKGFLGKAPITDKTYLEQSDTAAIRVVNANGERMAEETFIINTEEEGDENTP